MHVHALRGGIEAKFWLWPEVKVSYDDGFGGRIVRELTGIIERHRGEIAMAYDEFFGDS